MEAVHRYEGTVNQVMGDGIMALFGAPVTHEDDPERAVRAALSIRAAIDRLNDRWPGMRDRLVEPGPKLRPHINVYVDRERGGLDTALEPVSRVDVIAAISGG